eukprot:357808-Chlamydomonas_euryale.AAC.9
MGMCNPARASLAHSPTARPPPEREGGSRAEGRAGQPEGGQTRDMPGSGEASCAPLCETCVLSCV